MNPRCPKCLHTHTHANGTFFRKSDSKTIKRWRCSACRHGFSQATLSTCYRQHKRRINPVVRKLFVSGVSQRRMCLILNVTRKTIKRKLAFLGIESKQRNQNLIKTIAQEELRHIQMDELITYEHTKLKPVSLSVATTKSRLILAGEICRIPAFGHLAKLSRAKYGKRPNEIRATLNRFMEQLSAILPEHGRIDSDEHHLYPDVIKRHLPHWQHRRYKSKRSSSAGLGELKLRGYDPLFSINHTLAMLRANMNRLFRRSWNTTKCLESFMHHFWIYVDFHNTRLLEGR